ncbi:hypothetical protein FOA52_008965, partial [Chlamydomonas sp. UWO 241]
LIQQHLHGLEASRSVLTKRVEVLEADPRVRQLMEQVKAFEAHKVEVAHSTAGLEEKIESLERQLRTLDGKVERGPPGLWALTEKVGKQAEELATAQAGMVESTRALERLERSLQQAQALLGHQKELSSTLATEAQDLGDALQAGLARGIKYTDSRLDNMALKHEVEALRRLVEGVRREAKESVESMSLRVKFDLLHDEAPEVASIKAFMQSVEASLSRSSAKFAYLEESVQREEARGKAIEAGWNGTKDQLNALVLNGELDVGKLRRDLMGVKAMFEDMGKLALHGDIMTVSQAERMIDDRLQGSSMDYVLSRKVHESGPLATFLSGLATKHEVEALRKVLLEANQNAMAIGSGISGGSGAAPADGASSSAAAAQKANGKRAPTGGGSAAAAAAAAAAAGNVDPAQLRQLYKRVAAAEEASTAAAAHCAALDARLASAEGGVAHAVSRTDTLALQAATAGGGVGGGGSGGGAAYMMGSRGGGGGAEASVRAVLNESILPELVSRQVSDTQRLLRYMDDQMRTFAKAYEVEALRRSVSALRGELHSGAPAPPTGSKASAAATAGAGAGADATAGEDAAAGAAGAPGPAAVAAGAEQAGEPAGDCFARLGALEAHVAALGAPMANGEGAGAAADHGLAGSSADADVQVRLQVLEVRLREVEADHAPARSGGGSGAPSYASSPGMESALSDLKAAVAALSAQQPLLAKGFELEGLRRAFADMRAEMAGASPPSEAAAVSALQPEGASSSSAASTSDVHGSESGKPQAASRPVTAAAGAGAGREVVDQLSSMEVALRTLEERVGVAEASTQAVAVAGAAGTVASAASAADGAAALPALQRELTSLRGRVDSGAQSLAAVLARMDEGGGVGGGRHATSVGDGGRAESGEEEDASGAGAAPAHALPPPPPSRSLASPEVVDAELAGLMHDLVHAAHEELMAVKDGPLPGCGPGLNNKNVHEAARRRLLARPLQVQQKVELLERAKRQLARLMACAATSTVDHLCLAMVMLDMRVQLIGDAVEQHKEHLGVAFSNFESVFDFLKTLQEGVNSKAAAGAVEGLDRALRSIARECMQLGPSTSITGRDGAFTGSPLSSASFWSAVLSPAAAAGDARPRSTSPSQRRRLSASTSLTSPAVGALQQQQRDRPRTATGSTTGSGGQSFHSRARMVSPAFGSLPAVVLPGVPAQHSAPAFLAAAPYPPPHFLKEQRNILAEQERVLAHTGATSTTITTSRPGSSVVGLSLPPEVQLPPVAYMFSQPGRGSVNSPTAFR